MKFSAQEEYGLRCLITIARGECTTIPEISKREGLSEAHVAKLLSTLRKANLITSTRGQSGGYALTKPASETYLSEVIDVLGGRLYDEGFCERHSGIGGTCNHSSGCTIRSVWHEVQVAVDSVLSRVTLEDIVRGEMEEDGSLVSGPMPFPVTVTEEAIQQAKRLIARKGTPGCFMRIGVKGGGCSGLEYIFKLDTRRIEGDTSFFADGLEIVCDPKSAVFLRGSTLKYTGNLIGGGFAFENPNAARSCGCGTSFQPKDKVTAGK
jgi:iron-sulfur cluster assembly accessory protein